MPTFRPSCRARLQLRIDEATDTEMMARRLEQDPPEGAAVQDSLPTTDGDREEQLKRNRARRRFVTRERDRLSLSEVDSALARLDEQRNKLQLGGAGEQTRPQGLSYMEQDDLTVGIDVLPTMASITRNGVTDADEVTLEFDARVVPIDPRVMRSAFVDLVIGAVSPEDYERGVFLEFRDDGSLLSNVSRVPGQEVRLGSSTRFVGYLDTWRIVSDEEGDTIVARGRDMTAPLISTPLRRGESIDLQKPLADGVQELVDRYPATRGMRVVFGNPNVVDVLAQRGGRGPTPGDAVPKPRKPRKGKQSKRLRQGDPGMSVWDHIMDTVVATGYVPIIRGMQLYLMEPRTFYAGGSSTKRMVYGRNLINLDFERKFGGVSLVPTIEVRCVDPEIGRTRWARAPAPANTRSSGVFGVSDPPKSTRANKVTPGGTATEQIQTIVVTGITDGETLERVARSIYEQTGRQEIEGSWETADITSLDSEDEGDLLNLHGGDAVELLIAPLNAATTEDSTDPAPGGSRSSLQELTSMLVARRRAFLEELGYKPQAAQRLALAQEQTHLQTVFRVQGLVIEFSQEDGLAISCDCSNFLVVREAADAGDQPASTDVLLATGGSTSDAAAAQRAASAAGNTTGAAARAGQVTPEEYGAQAGEDRARQQRITQARRKYGG